MLNVRESSQDIGNKSSSPVRLVFRVGGAYKQYFYIISCHCSTYPVDFLYRDSGIFNKGAVIMSWIFRRGQGSAYWDYRKPVIWMCGV